MPVGVVPSPSRWWSENPLLPIQPVHGPPAGAQHRPTRCHNATEATVGPDPGSTVISWVAPPVEASVAGRLRAQATGVVAGGATTCVGTAGVVVGPDLAAVAPHPESKTATPA